MKAIKDFAFQCGAKLSLNPEFILNKSGRYFLVNKNLLGYVQKDFYYAGTYLGKAKKGKFFPSFNLLAMLAKGEANSGVALHLWQRHFPKRNTNCTRFAEER